MKVSAVIAEYNIFHNGHKYMIDKIREQSDAVVVVMSGSFVQRGDAAITDKWSRAEAALLNGADLVIELPVIYALNTAQRFAQGAVSVINELGIADEICFGAETGDTARLERTAEILLNEPPEVSDKIKRYVSVGMSYPSAREMAYKNVISPELLQKPNNILALEYICALKRIKSKIRPRAIARYGVGHHDAEVFENTASATAIRCMIFDKTDYSPYIPKAPVYSAIPYDLSRLDNAVIYKLRTIDADKLALINDISEGLENRIKKMSMTSSCITQLAESIKTKRYTRTRINRILISSLLDLTSDLCNMPPEYVRILGTNKTGMKLLAAAKKTCRLPIITKAADFDRNNPIFQAELRATDAFSLCAPTAELRNGGLDFTVSPVIL